MVLLHDRRFDGEIALEVIGVVSGLADLEWPLPANELVFGESDYVAGYLASLLVVRPSLKHADSSRAGWVLGEVDVGWRRFDVLELPLPVPGLHRAVLEESEGAVGAFAVCGVAGRVMQGIHKIDDGVGGESVGGGWPAVAFAHSEEPGAVLALEAYVGGGDVLGPLQVFGIASYAVQGDGRLARLGRMDEDVKAGVLSCGVVLPAIRWREECEWSILWLGY